MARSLKRKFVDDHLMSKMEKLVASEQNKLLKLGLAVQQSSLSSSDTQSLYMMVVNTYLCTSLRIWLAIS